MTHVEFIEWFDSAMFKMNRLKDRIGFDGDYEPYIALLSVIHQELDSRVNQTTDDDDPLG